MVKSDCPSPYRKQGEGNKKEKRKSTNGSKDKDRGGSVSAKKQNWRKIPMRSAIVSLISAPSSSPVSPPTHRLPTPK